MFTATHAMHLPTAALSIDQLNRSPGFLNFQLSKTTVLDSEGGFRSARVVETSATN